MTTCGFLILNSWRRRNELVIKAAAWTKAAAHRFAEQIAVCYKHLNNCQWDEPKPKSESENGPWQWT